MRRKVIFIMTLVHSGQYEEMKKTKEDLEEELQRERSAHRHYKRECAALKEEYNNLRLKVRDHDTFQCCSPKHVLLPCACMHSKG